MPLASFGRTYLLDSLFAMQRSRALLRASRRFPFERQRHWHPCSLAHWSYTASPNQCRSFFDSKNYVSNPIERDSLECLRLSSRAFLGFGDGDEESGLSKQHKEHRTVGYTPEQLFAVVAAVDLYEDFVPWCQKSLIIKQTDTYLEAELEIGFKFFVERYISHVELKQPSFIKASASKSNLFKYLINEWEFKPGPTTGSCDLYFLVDFQFKSPLYNQVVDIFYNEVVSRLVCAFEKRCYVVYGPGSKIYESGQVA